MAKKRTFELEIQFPQHRAQVFKALSEQWWHQVSGEGLPGPVLIRLGKTPEGALACTGLILGATDDVEISARDARIPLGAILEDISSRLDRKTLRSGVNPNLTAFYNALMDVAIDESAAPLTKPKRRPGPTPLSDDHFRWFADWYRHALVEAPNSPVTMLHRELGVSKETIRRWRREAVARRFLDLNAKGDAAAKRPPSKKPPKGKGKP
ncbi:MAG: hypothetical protein WD004_00015 [Actinomycetota bacterium]